MELAGDGGDKASEKGVRADGGNIIYNEGASRLPLALHRAAEAVASADALLFCCGAGMGVDSGLGTYRGANACVYIR
eukprot:COSAG02_NODE_179_length_31090_cov_49.813785_34_plen_77_part_00